MAVEKRNVRGELVWYGVEAAEKQSPSHRVTLYYDPRETKITNVRVDITLWWEGTSICSYSWCQVYLNDYLIYKAEWGSTCEAKSSGSYDAKELFKKDNFIDVKAYHDRRIPAIFDIFNVSGQSKLKYNITIEIEYTGVKPGTKQESKPPGWRPETLSEKIQEFLATPITIGIIGAISTFVLLWLFRKRK
jgi:hypothetical protein